MQWDPRRYLLSSVLNRISVFTNLDPSQLQFSGTSFSVANLEVDPEKLSSGSFQGHQATIDATSVELGTAGLRIALGGVKIDASISNLSADLGLSVVLEQVEQVEPSDSEPQPPPGFFAQTVLSQLRVDIHELEFILHIGDLDLQIDIGTAFLEKTRLGIQDIVISSGSEILAHINNVSVGYDFPLTSADVQIDCVKANTLPILSTVIEVVNVLLSFGSNGESSSAPPPAIAVRVDSIVLADCPLDSTGQFEQDTTTLELIDLQFKVNKITLEDLKFPGLVVLAPVLELTLGDPITVKLPHPVTFELKLEALSEFISFSKEIALVIASINTPEAEEPTALSIDLPDIKLKLGQFTLLVFSNEFTLEKLLLNEVLITCATDRLVVASPEFELARNRINIRRITAQLSQDTLDEIELITSTIVERGLRQPLFITDKPPKQSTSLRLSIDSIVLTLFEYTLSTTLIASFNGNTIRAKLKPELVFNENRITASVQLVLAENLLIYMDIIRARFVLKQLEQSSESSGQSKPFKAPFPIELCIKGQAEFVSPITTLGLKCSEVLNIGIEDDSINAHLPGLILNMLDKAADIPIATLTELNMRGNFSKNQFATTIKSIDAGTCADSLDSVKRLAQFLQPVTKQAVFTVDGPEDLDVFDDIDDAAFVPANTTAQPSLQYVESYYPNTRARDTQITFEQLDITPQPFNIQDDYLLELRSASPKLVRQSKIRFRLLVKAFKFDLYDGFDFDDTRKALSAALDRVSSISAKLGDMTFENNESPIVGDLMFNSIYIGARPSVDNDLQQEINREMGGNSLGRSEAPKLSLRAARIKLELKSFDVEKAGEILSHLNVQIEEIIVRDLVPTSKWKALISYDNSVQGSLKGSMMSISLETVYGTDPELRIKAAICPLRVQLDQDTLEFATRFFEFQPEKSGIIEEEEEEEEEEVDPLERPSVGVAGPNGPFIQRFEISDIHICLDYRPKKVDYAGLRSGHAAEFMNLFVVERSKVVLRQLVLHGISGYANLGKSLNDVWTPDVRNNQLVTLLSGLGPLKSIFQVAGGIKKFFVVPVREYKRESGVASGIRRGSTSFAKNTANELVKLGVRVINGPKKSTVLGNESALID